MSSQDSWSCLSVQHFLSLCNWEGKTEAGERGRWGAQEKQTSWQCLSVQQFFSLCNWEGQPLENCNWEHAAPSSRLTMQVREFFQFIPWEGNPEIGSLPKASFIPPTLSTSVKTTLTDLSELF